MRSGLEGRYLSGLETWNKARSLASEFIRAFTNGDSIHAVIEAHNLSCPTVSEIKSVLNQVVFSQGRDKVDTVARHIMKWSEWTVPFGEDAMRGAAV